MVSASGKERSMDIRLNYVEQGEGIPFIMLHGNEEDKRYFKYQMEYFSKSYRVILIETRGHGESPRGDAPFTIDQFAEDLKDFLDQQSISKMILLGFSDGGNTALIFAKKYPQYLIKLIVNGANLSPFGVILKEQVPICVKYYWTCIRCLFNKKLISKKEMLGLMVKDPHIDPKSLKAISVPTLVIAGTNDMIRRSETERIAGAIPGSRLEFIEGDHFIARRKRDVFNPILEEFLKDGREIETETLGRQGASEGEKAGGQAGLETEKTEV